MPRAARKKSNSGIYHIMLRGINRQQIFEDDEDNQRFIETLSKYKEECGYSIYAYCLMGNHLHILLKENQQDLTLIFKKIAGGFCKHSSCVFADDYLRVRGKVDFLFAKKNP